MSMTMPQQCRYHMQGAMSSLLRIWWHHKVHHMWFPIHSKKCCTKQEGNFVRISFHLWMTIPHPCITSLPMTRHGVSCTTCKSMVSQLGDIRSITPSLFRKNWWNTTLLCYHICHILHTSAFQTFFLIYLCHNTKHVRVPLGTANTNA